MLQSDVNLGDHILIALGDRPAALALVRATAANIGTPASAEVTLMHYLMPRYWEHGGEDTAAAIRERQREEREVAADERAEENRTAALFDRARAILVEAGVPAVQIRTELDWDEVDKNHAVLAALQRGDYSAVVVGEHDVDFLTRVFDPPLAEVLRRHAHGTAVWAISPQQLRSMASS